jgi:hypothetical protein
MLRTERVSVVIWTLVLALVCGLAPGVYAQNPTGNLEGIVSDAQGGALQGATVQITQPETGFDRSVTTDENGSYRASQLTPGNYNIAVTAQGFKKAVADSVTVQVGQTTPLDVQLTAGGVTETIEIQSSDVSLDRSDSKVDGVVTPLQIANLPLNGRNFLDLAGLQPGASAVDGASFDPTKANYTGVSLGGQAGRSTQISVDGGSVVDNTVGTTVQNFSQEIISEFQVGISNIDVSAGASSSGSVNVLTKSGNNEFHGNGYIYYRDDQFAAFPALNRVVDGDLSDGVAPFETRRLQFDREQYGGTFSGPIVKDRMFFFGNVEVNNQDAVTVYNIPDPLVVGFNGTTAQPFNGLLATAKFDWRISDKHSFFTRYSHDDSDQLAAFPLGTGVAPKGGLFSSNAQFNTNRADGFVFGLTSAFTSTLVNDARVHVSDFANEIVPDPSTPAGPEIRIREANGDQNARFGPNYLAPQSTYQSRFQVRDDMTWSRGNHTIRFGLDFERSSLSGGFNLYQPGAIRIFGPTSTGVPLVTEEGALDTPVRDIRFSVGSTELPYNNGGDPTVNYRWQPYVNDQWKIHPRLTLNLGLAYRYDSNLFNTDLTRPAIIAGVFSNGTAAPENDINNFAPRVGFAWDVNGDARTIVRGGAGIYYDTTIDNLRLFERADLGPPGSQITLLAGAIVSPLLPGGDGAFGLTPGDPSGFITLRDMIALLPAVRADLESRAFSVAGATSVEAFNQVSGPIFSSDFEVPYTIQYSFGLQRELPWNMVLQADLNYRKGLHEVVAYDANCGECVDRSGNPTPMLPISQWGDHGAPNTLNYADSSGISVYKALLVRLDKRFSDSFQLTGSYTLSRINAIGSDQLGLGFGGGDLGFVDQRNLRGTYGPTGNDRTHRLVVSSLYEFPKYSGDSAWRKGLLDGWSMSLISTMQSGVPLTALLPDQVDLSGNSPGLSAGLYATYLPGTRNGSLGRDVKSVSELNNLISAYNANINSYAARFEGGVPVDAHGTPLRRLALLPEGTKIGGDSVLSQDVRLTKKFYFGETIHLDLIAEAFNLFNFSNDIGRANNSVLVAQEDLDDWNNNVGGQNPGGLPFPNNPFEPISRATNIFGVGGPRSFQFAARFTF